MRYLSKVIKDVEIKESPSWLKGALYLPFGAVDGCGQTVAQSIVDARDIKAFTTKNDFMNRTQVSKTVFKKFEDYGVFGNLPDDNQISLDLGI